MSRPPDAEARLRRLEDRAAITDLVVAFGAAADYGDERMFAETFTEDGVFEVFPAGASEPVIRYDGRAALAGRARNHSRAPEKFHKHVYTNIRVRFDDARPGTAEVESYFLLFATHEDEPALLAFGRDLDRAVRGADGRWRLARRRVELEARAKPPVWTPGWADRAPAPESEPGEG